MNNARRRGFACGKTIKHASEDEYIIQNMEVEQIDEKKKTKGLGPDCLNQETKWHNSCASNVYSLHHYRTLASNPYLEGLVDVGSLWEPSP